MAISHPAPNKKSWSTMTVEENLEALRKDIEVAYQNLNGLNARDNQLEGGISEVAGQIQALRKAVEATK